MCVRQNPCRLLAPRHCPKSGLGFGRSRNWFGRDLPKTIVCGDYSPFAFSSIQSTAASERNKPVGPSSPTHQASDATTPPAVVIAVSTAGDNASPL